MGSFHDPGMKVLDPGMPLSRLIFNLQYDKMGMVELVTASRFAKKHGSKYRTYYLILSHNVRPLAVSCFFLEIREATLDLC